MGVPRRFTRRSSREPGITPSRAIEYMVRAVSAWAAIPQDRNAPSTSAANGFVDHEPNASTTDVVTGSTSSPRTTAPGSGWASAVATAFSNTITATASTTSHTERGTRRAAPLVSSALPTHASNPMNTQPLTASAARSAANTEPPDAASAPSVPPSSENSWSRKASNSTRPMPTSATTSAVTPMPRIHRSVPIPAAPTSAHSRASTMPAATSRPGVGSTSSSVSAQGAPR